MKSPSLPVALLVLIFLGFKPLCAKAINTPFGSIPDTLQYLESGENSVKRTITITQEANSENEQQPSVIRASVDGSPSIIVSQSVIQQISGLSMSDQTKINLFIALIIIQQEIDGYNPLNTDNADSTDGAQAQTTMAFVSERYSFSIPSRDPNNRFSLHADIPTSATSSWHLNLTNPLSKQFTVIMSPEPSSVEDVCTETDSDDDNTSCCCNGLWGRAKRYFSY
ncbi:hypothetical protein [Endozoicomonas lisbonensis]|uniref:Uncharacterized protein n=1 Tax=Endozoicomonas lisbonensis TaxID=3120522 RepID=A0ABV2SL51_9GAMM